MQEGRRKCDDPQMGAETARRGPIAVIGGLAGRSDMPADNPGLRTRGHAVQVAEVAQFGVTCGLVKPRETAFGRIGQVQRVAELALPRAGVALAVTGVAQDPGRAA